MFSEQVKFVDEGEGKAPRGRDSIAQGGAPIRGELVALGNDNIYRASPEGARFQRSQANLVTQESRPLGAETATLSPKTCEFWEQML